MGLKRESENKVFVEQPSRSWVYDQIKQNGNLKRLVPQPLSKDRSAASTVGNVKAWFDRIEAEIDPAG